MESVRIVSGTAVPLDRSDVDTDQIIPSDWLKRVERTDFGTGSSREHAVWAIQQYGFQAVISPRFGDIFRNNSTKNGLVPVVVAPEVGEQLLRAIEADPSLELTIDVERRTLEAPALGLSVGFPLDDSVQHRFLEGLDDIGLTLRQVDRIASYETSRPDWMPTTA